MTALLVGSGLAVAALLYVLLPLVRGAGVTDVAFVVEPSDAEPVAGGIEALREIEFDRATGKLSDEDYASLRARYAPLACATCGPRPESDALFCSDCGCTLLASCLRCGAAVEAPQARFCTGCGAALAA